MPKSISRVRKTTAASNTVADKPRSLTLLRSSAVPAERLDRELLEFDVEDDMESIIPMPPSIAAPIRAAISKALAHRFEFADELDRWLHAAHGLLGGATPFEYVVAGEGMAVLRVLLDGADNIAPEVAELLAQHPMPALKLVT